MSETHKPHVSETEARAVAEGARETTWEAPSFVRELFLGDRAGLGLAHVRLVRLAHGGPQGRGGAPSAGTPRSLGCRGL